jgi:hypothetical protein
MDAAPTTLSMADALKLVLQRLQTISTPGAPFAIVESHTIEKPYGWIFFYQSKKFLQTGLDQDKLAGNGPIIVNKYEGTIEFLGSPTTWELITEYDNKFLADYKKLGTPSE